MNTGGQPPERPTTPFRKWWHVVTRTPTGLATVAATLTALVAIVTNWEKLEQLLFPSEPVPTATIIAGVDPYITLREFDAQAQLPSQGPTATAAVARRGRATPGFVDRFATYSVSAGAPPPAGRLVAEEHASGTEQSTGTIAGQKIKAEGERVSAEAKHAEETVAQEAKTAAAEQKSAQVLVQEEQQKEREAQKRAEETPDQGATQAKAEEAAARKAVAEAKATVLAKKQEASRPLTQRRIEAGTPASRVEAVLHEAHLPTRCRPTCGLKPIVEKVLKDTTNNTAAAAAEVRAVTHSSGARVHYEVTLTGLEGKVAVLTYSLVQTDGAPPPEPFLDTVVIKTVAPRRDPEVLRGICWVPVPSSSRRYYVVLTVHDGREEVGYMDTRAFR